ncbi:MAG: cobyrinic acid a,c-diamide synthase [Betaproteobacteria bacterium HGW-Betaproteobacteria-10]|nr:MAG: cobyrinic acid a,c-diamide synthase [Betaproteobacteria bacterium HGW-Betaproteobacteria-10]
MKAFLVANPKGGSGKSTLATNLAGYFAAQRQDVMLGDIDRQQSSRTWLAIRPFELPSIETWEVGPDKVSRPPKRTSHVVLDTPAGLHGKMLEKVLKLSTRVIVPVQPSMFDMLATRHFLEALLAEKTVRKGKVDVAVIGMRVDARTRAASELERFFATFDLPVLAYLRDTQVYVQASGAGMTIFDLPPARAERDLAQWRAIIDWVEAG